MTFIIFVFFSLDHTNDYGEYFFTKY